MTSFSGRNQGLFWVEMNFILLKRLHWKFQKDRLKSHCLQLVGKAALELSLQRLVHCPQLMACALEVLTLNSHLAFTIMASALSKKMSKCSQHWCLRYDLEEHQVGACRLWCCRTIPGCNASLSTTAKNSIWTFDCSLASLKCRLATKYVCSH